jgi:hypothetical protein
MIHNRFDNYNKKHCWQYDIRLNNLQTDLEEANITDEIAKNIKISDFVFNVAETRKEQLLVRKFIEKHEWLGKACGFSQYYFTAHYKNILAGVIVMGTPNAFNLLLGEENRDLEILINRGACISWSPKNLASSLMSFSLNWMVKNTRHRLFTAYSDPTAKELGTIYQACNFYYLGNKFGASKKYNQPYNNQLVSDRWFRTRCAYKNYAKDLCIVWDDNWLGKGRKVVWERVPDDIEKKLRDYSKKKQSESKFIEIPSKHKYAYILGKDKKETRKLRKLFEERNKIYSYPKERGI